MRKSPHVVFFGIPHPPHSNPTLPVISVLVRRGYRVTYVTSESYAARAVALGADVATYQNGPALPPDFKPWLTLRADLNVPNFSGLCPLASWTLEKVAPVFESDKPDLIIYDLVSLAGRIAAHRWRVPAVQISPQYAFDPENFESQIKDHQFREWVHRQAREADRFLQAAGVVADEFMFHREGLNVYTFPKAFQPSGAALTDSTCLYAGRCPAEQPSHGEWHVGTAQGRPVLLLSASTTYVRDVEYFKAYCQALDGTQWHVVIAVSDQFDIAALGRLPKNFEIVRGISLVKVLPYASLFVFQGGTTSATEAVYHGVPQIAVTCGFAELEWCADTNITRLGLGVHLKKEDFSVDNIKGAVQRASENREILSNVKRVRHIVRREPGAEEVVNRIDELLDASTRGQIHVNST